MIVPEVVDQRAPAARIHVLGARDHDVRVRVHRDHLGLDREEALRGVRHRSRHTGLELQAAFGDARHRDDVGRLRMQAGGGELLRLEARMGPLVLWHGIAPGQPAEQIRLPPQLRTGRARHELGMALEVLGRAAGQRHAEHEGLAERPAGRHRGEIHRAVGIAGRQQQDRRAEVEDGGSDRDVRVHTTTVGAGHFGGGRRVDGTRSGRGETTRRDPPADRRVRIPPFGGIPRVSAPRAGTNVCPWQTRATFHPHARTPRSRGERVLRRACRG